MVTIRKNEPTMPVPERPLPAVDEIRQLNRLFLDLLRAEPLAAVRFGLSARALRHLRQATDDQVERAAALPRALFRLRLPAAGCCQALVPSELAAGTGPQAFQLTLMLYAWNLSRQSGYAARLLLGLSDRDIRRLRTTAISELLGMAVADDVVGIAFDEFDWIWPELLTETRPERWRQLLLLGFQPAQALVASASPLARHGVRPRA